MGGEEDGLTTRPMAWESEERMEMAPRSWRISSAYCAVGGWVGEWVEAG